MTKVRGFTAYFGKIFLSFINSARTLAILIVR